MSAQVYRCKDLSHSILGDCKAAAEKFAAASGRAPCLTVVLVGEDPASTIYVSKKAQTCRDNAIDARDVRLPAGTSQAELEALIAKLNADKEVDGILVQSPLPQGLDELKIQRLIDPAKDVDSFHPQNVGRLCIDANEVLANGLPPCTPAGVMEVLRANDIPIAGKHAVVVGRSNIVGKPMAQMLLAQSATVTICHSRTADLAAECRRADIVVSAVGKAKFIGAEHVKPGATLIDVGINRIEVEGKAKLAGDIDRAAVQD